MTFVRVKRVKGHPYAYLVRSEWDPERRKPRQRVVKYLGRVENASLEDVPEAHRRDAGVLAFFAGRAPRRAEQPAELESELSRTLLDALLAGVRERVAEETDRSVRALGLTRFVETVLTPAMHEVGARWQAGLITPVDEHLASNLAAGALRAHVQALPAPASAPTVVVALPQGEQHRLAGDALEAVLREGGFRVLNVSSGAPTAAIAKFARAHLPRALLVSVTMPHQVPTAQELARVVWAETDGRVEVLLGGQAIAALDAPVRAALHPARVVLRASDAVRALAAPGSRPDPATA